MLLLNPLKLSQTLTINHLKTSYVTIKLHFQQQESKVKKYLKTIYATIKQLANSMLKEVSLI